MPRDFYPRREVEQLGWTRNFSHLINVDPGLYGIAPLAASEYEDLQLAFAEAFRRTNDPTTATSSAVFAKNEIRRLLEDRSRALAGIVRANREVTPGHRFSLGLNIRKSPTRINAPTTAPRITIRSVRGSVVQLGLRDGDSLRFAKPANVVGACVYYFFGETPPLSIEEWKSYGQTSEAKLTITFPSTTAPGAKVHFCACWLSPRLERGPIGDATYTHIQYGSMVMGTGLQEAA